jgi:arabinofuranosyltransferase
MPIKGAQHNTERVLLPAMPGWVRRWGPLLAALAVTLLLLERQGLAFVDDAFISFRHVRNFVAGDGLVFNPGARVEGYSNFLYVLMLSGMVRAGLPMLGSALTVGWIGALLTLVVVRQLSLALHPERPVFAHLAAVLLCINASFIYWATRGLETPLNSLLLCLTAYTFYGSHIRAPQRPKLAMMLHGLCIALFYLSRPENVVLCSASLAFSVVLHLYEKRRLTTAYVFMLAIPLSVIGLHVGWRLSYYGHPLPNTVYAKSFYGALLASGDRNVVGCIRECLMAALPREYVLNYISTAGGMVAVAVSLAGFARRRLLVFKLYGFMLCACYVALVWSARWDWMKHGRLLVSALPLALILFQEGLFDLLSFFKHRMVRGVVCAGLLAAVVWRTDTAFSLTPGTFENSFEKRHPSVRIASLLNSLSLEGDVLATDVAGRVPYRYHGPVIDVFGLAEPHIAHNGAPRLWGKNVGGKLDRDYVIRQKPAFYQFVRGFGAFFFAEHPDVLEEYVVVQGAGTGYVVLIRKDRADLPVLENTTGGEFVQAGLTMLDTTSGPSAEDPE